MALLFKPEVRIVRFTEQIYVMLDVAAEWSMFHGVDVRVSSINDPAQGRVPHSLHAFDLAVDVEPVSGLKADMESLADFYARDLEPQFDVVYESSHIHVEWDAHRGPLREIAG